MATVVINRKKIEQKQDISKRKGKKNLTDSKPNTRLMSASNLTNHQQNFQNRLLDKNFKTCVTYHKNLVGVNAFPVFLLQISLFSLISQLLHLVLKRLKQPKVVCNVLAGIILGPSVLGHFERWNAIFHPEEMLLVNTMSIMGGIYFIFIVTLKMDKSRILKTVRNGWSVSVTCLVVPFTISSFLTSLLHSYIPGVNKGPFLYFFSVTLAKPFFPVIAHAMNELNLLTSELGQLAISCSILSELLSWMNLILAMLFKANNHILKTEITFCALAFFMFFIVRPAVKWIIRTTPEGKAVKEIYMVAMLLLPGITGALSDATGLNFMSGAVLTGLVVPAGPPLGSAVVKKSEIIMENIFMPFFYIHIGQLFNVYSITNWKAFAMLQIIILAAYFARVAAIFLSLIFYKISIRNAILFGLILNIKGVIELLLLTEWRTHKYVDDQTVTTIMLSHTAVTAIVIPLISMYYDPNSTRLQSSCKLEKRTRTLGTTSMDSELRILCGIHHEDSIHNIINLLKALNPTEMSPICAYVVHLVELVGRAESLSAPYDAQRRRLKENSTDRIMRAVTNQTKSSCVSLTSQPFKIIAPYHTMHESICKLAEDKFAPLILIPFHKGLEFQEIETCLHQLNLNIQAYAQCTIGILVDSGLPRSLSSTHFSYDVAVFFLGGADDREVMALVSRMAGHPSLTVTVFKIDFKGNQAENECERQIDEYVMNEFRERNAGNACVVCREMMVNDSTELMSSIRLIENIYDLVIVGKQRGIGSPFEQEMKPWLEYAELGIIGDMLASADFYGGTMSVLVVHCTDNQLIATDPINAESPA